jgi:hemoglobin-like flavoprotein
MTPEQIAAVQRSFSDLGTRTDELARQFYARLFALDPSVEDLFSTDPAVQRAKFVDELTEIVRSISALDRFVPRALDLGARHVAYRVKPDHYRLVGQALIGALGAVLGDAFDAELEAAWKQAYDLVAETMMEGAAGVPLPSNREN